MDIDIILDLSNLIRYKNQNVRKSCYKKSSCTVKGRKNYGNKETAF
jgi:hypothetical protein